MANHTQNGPQKSWQVETPSRVGKSRCYSDRCSLWVVCFECISKIELLVVPLNLCMQNIGVSQFEFGLQISGFVASSSGFFGYMRDLRLIRLRLSAPIFSTSFISWNFQRNSNHKGRSASGLHWSARSFKQQWAFAHNGLADRARLATSSDRHIKMANLPRCRTSSWESVGRFFTENVKPRVSLHLKPRNLSMLNHSWGIAGSIVARIWSLANHQGRLKKEGMLQARHEKLRPKLS